MRLPSAVLHIPHPLIDLTISAAPMPWGEPALVAVVLGTPPPMPELLPDAQAADYLAGLADRFRCYLDGGDPRFEDIPLYFGDETAFTRDVLSAARNIPRGTVISYAELAIYAGHTGAARAAAMVMRRNILMLVVPCHRVVAADGIGGYMGAVSGPAISLKKRLLELEGAAI